MLAAPHALRLRCPAWHLPRHLPLSRQMGASRPAWAAAAAAAETEAAEEEEDASRLRSAEGRERRAGCN